MKFVFSFIILLMSSVMPLTAQAENTGSKKAILVMDASGSMWGQIDGTPKITIARNVVREMLADWDKDTELGLIVYGHRKKGDCGDIETLIPVTTVNSATFVNTLDKINPKGKTPIGAAVKQAADSLKYTEENATVILVSDGIETCGMDPCKLGAELSKKGLDFKTHVIGFDLKSTQAIDQLKCLATSRPLPSLR